MSYGGVTEGDVRDLIHGCIFTRGPKDLHNTAVWIGGNNMSAGEQLLAMAQDALFAPFRVSIMLDSNGSNTTAVAAVVKIEETLGDLDGQEGRDPGGHRTGGPARGRPAGQATAPRSPSPRASRSRARRRGSSSARGSTSQVEAVTMNDPSTLPESCDGVDVLLNSGPAGVLMVPPSGVDRGQDAQGRGGPQRRAAARHRGRRGERRRRGAGRRRRATARSASATSRPSCTRPASPGSSPGTTWCSTPRAIADVARELSAKQKLAEEVPCRASSGSTRAR